MIQRRAARFVCGRYDRFDSVSSMIEELGWESLSHRRKNFRLRLLSRFCHDSSFTEVEEVLLEPNYLNRWDHRFKIREIHSYSNSYYWSFFPRTIRDWNSATMEDLSRFVSLDIDEMIH